MSEEPRPAPKLSRKEEVIVKAYEENLLEFGKIHHNDPRDKIYNDVVVWKFGSYDIAGERMTPTPLWGFVFEKNVCPSCNTHVGIVKGEIVGKLDKKEDLYICNNCHFSISAKLFDEADDRNNREGEWSKKDNELRERMSKDKFGKERTSKLAELGGQRAIAKLGMMLKDEKT